MPAGPWANARRLLAVRLDNLGDVVMLTPALRALRHALPDAHLTLLASPAGGRAAPLLPWVDEVMVEEVLWQRLGVPLAPAPEGELALVDRISRRHFDVAVVFTSFAQSPYPPAYACALAGVPVRMGQSKEFGGAVLTHWLRPAGDEQHQVDRSLALLGAHGLPPAGRHLELRVPGEEQSRADDLLAGHGLHSGHPYLVVAPGASAPSRRYPPERFGVVARHLADVSSWPVVVVGGEGDRERADRVVLGAGPERALSLAGKTSVPVLAGVIRRSRLVVTNNSGPMHIADAFARPLVVAFAGTELESQWHPRASPARLLRRPTPCSPCFGFECPYELACLDLDPQTLVHAALEVLAADRGGHPKPGASPDPVAGVGRLPLGGSGQQRRDASGIG